jgi:hypothetical protein
VIFNLRKLNELEGRIQVQTKITMRFTAFENLSDNEDINWAWEDNEGISKPQLKRF